MIEKRFPAKLTLIYPTPSLIWQLHCLFDRRQGTGPELVFDRSLPGIRHGISAAAGVIIDATDDPASACEAYLQAARNLGANAVAVYTERTLENLEILVRTNGSLFFLGPLEEHEWIAYFDRADTASVIPFPALSEQSGSPAVLGAYGSRAAEIADDFETSLIPFHTRGVDAPLPEDDHLSAMLAETILLRRDLRTLAG